MGYALVTQSRNVRSNGNYEQYPVGHGEARIVGVRFVDNQPHSLVMTIDRDYLRCTVLARFRLALVERLSEFDPYAPGFAPWDISWQRCQLPTLPARYGLHLLDHLIEEPPTEPVIRLSTSQPAQPSFSTPPPRSGLGVGRNPTGRRLH